MFWLELHNVFLAIQRSIAFMGVLIILSGVIIALFRYIAFLLKKTQTHGSEINNIRLTLGRVLILGLEFIVAADLISTTTAPDYYSIGIVAIVVAIRTVLSFSINRELMSLRKE